MKNFLLCSLVLAAACVHAAEESAADIARVREAGKQLIARLAERRAAEEASCAANKAWETATDKKAAERAVTAALDAEKKAGDAVNAADEVFKEAASKARKESARMYQQIGDALLAAQRAAAKKAYDERPQAEKDFEEARKKEMMAILAAGKKAYDDLPQAEKATREELMAAVMGVWKFAPMKDNGRIIEPAGGVTISADAYKVTTPSGTETTSLRGGHAVRLTKDGEVVFLTDREDKSGEQLQLHLRLCKDHKTVFVKWLTIYQGGGLGPFDFDSKLIRK